MAKTRLPLLAAVFAVSLALTGCASAATSSLDAEPGGATQDSAEPSDTMESESDADADAGEAGDTSSAATAGAYVEYSDGIIAETAGDKALFFHAPWCPQCRALEESIQSGTIPDGLTIIKVDFDTATELRQQYGVTLQTTIVYVDDNGEKLDSAVLYDETTLDALVAAAP